MGAFTHKSRDSQGRAFANQESHVHQSLGLADERPAAVMQRALDESLNQSAKVQSQFQLQDMFNESPRVVAQARLAAALSGRHNGTQPQPTIQRQEALEEEEPLQAKTQVVQKKENRTGLPDELKAGVENLSGLSMDDVQVHYNSSAPATVQALAYTQGTEIHVGPGQEQHLAHEAWHVAQQKQGRVRPTMQLQGTAINDDSALEREADAMGAKAVQEQAVVDMQSGGEDLSSAGDRRTRGESGVSGDDVDATLQASREQARHHLQTGGTVRQEKAVIQMARPGAIQHAISSCFAAALINTFTVTKSLKNLLIPANNNLGQNQNAVSLQNLLLRAVNTVDVNQVVPEQWIRNIMVSLHDNAIIQNATETEDVNQVIGGVITLLTGVNPRAGQPNNMPASTGLVVWDDSSTLQDAAAISVQQLQVQLNDQINTVFPNVIQINRQVGNRLLAPQSFNLHPAVGNAITYRLRSAIYRDTGYVGGHFVSYIDRGGDQLEEWWESDDVGPRVTPVIDIQSVGGAGQVEKPSEKEKEKSSSTAKSVPKEKQAVENNGDNMLREAITYVYERIDAQSAPQNNPPLVNQLADDAQRIFDQKYERDLIALVAHTKKIDVKDVGKLGKLNPEDFDQDLQKAAEDADKEIGANLKIQLPPITMSLELYGEARRQLQLQLEGLNRMTVKQWWLNTMLNRIKTTDQLTGGFSTQGGSALKHKADVILANNDQLATMFLDEVQLRLETLIGGMKSNDIPKEIIHVILDAEIAKQGKKNIFRTFEAMGGIRSLEFLTRAGLKGGIGRQHGEGDEEWFREVHGIGTLLAEASKKEVHAVLHNPDQCVGGTMEIICDKKERDRLLRARINYRIALRDMEEAEKQKHEAETTIPVPKKSLKNVSFKDFFKVSQKEKEIAEDTRPQKVESAKSNAQNKAKALASAQQIYLDLIRRHFGDSAVNSALGQAWMEDLDQKGATRVSTILDYVQAFKGDWDKTRMNVVMAVLPDKEQIKRAREKSEKNIAKKKKELEKQKLGQKRKRKETAVKEKVDKLKAKTKGSKSQISLEESFFRASKRRKIDELSSSDEEVLIESSQEDVEEKEEEHSSDND